MASTDMILGKFVLGDRVSFQVYPLALYGDIFNNCVGTDLVSAKTAKKFGIDPEAEHAKVYNSLPTGTVQDDAYSYNWLVLTLADGTERVIGLPWIKVDTIEVVTTLNAIITVAGVSNADVIKLRLALSSNGFSNFSIVTQ